jgi:hypothetical protein
MKRLAPDLDHHRLATITVVRPQKRCVVIQRTKCLDIDKPISSMEQGNDTVFVGRCQAIQVFALAVEANHSSYSKSTSNAVSDTTLSEGIVKSDCRV